MQLQGLRAETVQCSRYAYGVVMRNLTTGGEAHVVNSVHMQLKQECKRQMEKHVSVFNPNVEIFEIACLLHASSESYSTDSEI